MAEGDKDRAKMGAKLCICRCEGVSLGVIDEAIAAGAGSLREVKNRTRAGMGPCQGRICEALIARRLKQLAPAASQSPDRSRWPLRPQALGDLERPLPPRPPIQMGLMELDLDAPMELERPRSAATAPSNTPQSKTSRMLLIIGGGVVGSCAALDAAERGMKVTLVEAGALGAAASGRNAGAIRANGRHQSELSLAIESRRLWRELAHKSPIDFRLQRSGDLVVASTDLEVERLERCAVNYRELGLEVELFDGDRARRQVPGLHSHVQAGLYCESDLSAYPLLAMAGLAALMKRAGVEVIEGVPIAGLTRAGPGWRAESETRVFEADHVLIAAGPSSADLVRDLGIELPIFGRRSQMMVTDVSALRLPFLSGNGIYCRRSPFGNLLIGGGGAWEASDDRLGTAPPTLHRLASRFLHLFPKERRLQVLRSWAGTVALTPDHRPLIGALPGQDGLFIAAGFNGNGFGLGPGAGRLAMDLIEGRPRVPAFDPSRPSLRSSECKKRSSWVVEPVLGVPR